MCLLYKLLKALFTGDHITRSEILEDPNLLQMYNKHLGTRIALLRLGFLT
jgi:hypothetical protein